MNIRWQNIKGIGRRRRTNCHRETRADRFPRSGFMLAEVLIVMAIAGIMGGSLYAGLARSFSALQSSRHSLRATQILTEKLEIIRLYNWTQINTTGFVPSTFTEYYKPATNSSPGITYTVPSPGRMFRRPVVETWLEKPTVPRRWFRQNSSFVPDEASNAD